MDFNFIDLYSATVFFFKERRISDGVIKDREGFAQQEMGSGQDSHGHPPDEFSEEVVVYL